MNFHRNKKKFRRLLCNAYVAYAVTVQYSNVCLNGCLRYLQAVKCVACLMFLLHLIGLLEHYFTINGDVLDI